MRYVALLRGINVGGRTLIRMADLRSCVEEAGFAEVSTYIASGNVLFTSHLRGGRGLAPAIERAIAERLALHVTVVVLARPAYARIVAAIPARWIGDDDLRVNVAFVRPGTDARSVVCDLHPDPAVEEVEAVEGAILWATRREALTRSVMRRLIGAPAYREVTVRSLNTTLKLQELLRS